MYVRPAFGRLAGSVIEMSTANAKRLAETGGGTLLSPQEAAEHEAAMERIRDVAEALDATQPPTPMAESKPRRVGRPPKVMA